MKILYMGNHAESEFYELSFFLEAGHEVFSIGEQLFPDLVPDKRTIKGFQPDPLLVRDFWDLHPNYGHGKLIKLSKDFIQKFDLIIMSDYQEHLALNFREIFNCKKQALWVWRRRPKSNPKHFRTVQNIKGRGLRTLELPTGGKYQVTESHKAWMKALGDIELSIST